MLARTFPLVALALVAACGSDSGSPDPGDASDPPAVASEAEAATPDAADEPSLDPQARFLADNAARDGVIVTASGLQYEVLRAAEGPMPAADAVVTVHYTGTLIDGTEFDSSYARDEPATFPLGGVIEGFAEGLRLMSVGSRYRLVLPAALAYGDEGTGTAIGPGATLVFDVELLEIGSS